MTSLLAKPLAPLSSLLWSVCGVSWVWILILTITLMNAQTKTVYFKNRQLTCNASPIVKCEPFHPNLLHYSKWISPIHCNSNAPIILISDAAMPQLIASFPINSTIVWTEGSPLYSTPWKLGSPHTPLIATSPLIHSTLGVFSFYCFNPFFAFLPAIWYKILNATCGRLVTSTCMCRSTPATTT